MQNKRLLTILLAAAILLLVPYVAMQFTSEVAWSPFDFLVAGLLLFGTGILCEIVMRKVKSKQYRIALCVGILLALVLIWAELAVGIFGTSVAGS